MINVHSEEYILGQNIRNCRMKKKWTQKQLAIAVDVDRADISRYENGTKGAMNFKKLKIFAEALDVQDLIDHISFVLKLLFLNFPYQANHLLLHQVLLQKFLTF